MVSLTVLFTTMLPSPGAFRPKVRLRFSHFCLSGAGRPQQGRCKHSGAPVVKVLYRPILAQPGKTGNVRDGYSCKGMATKNEYLLWTYEPGRDRRLASTGNTCRARRC